jgi:hypothetical protein
MQPDVIMLMIYFSSETVPNEPGGSNSKDGSIDNGNGIVRTRIAPRMKNLWEGFLNAMDGRIGSNRNEGLRARRFADHRDRRAECGRVTGAGRNQPKTTTFDTDTTRISDGDIR